MRERRRCGPFTRGWKGPCEWAWKPAGSRSGSSGCWRSWDTSCGSEMRGGFGSCGAEAKDRPARCRTCCESAGGESFSADVGAHAAERDGRQLLLHRQKLVAHAHAGEEPVAALAVNQGVQRKRKSVERSEGERAGVVAATGLDGAAASRVARDAGSIGGSKSQNWTARCAEAERGRRCG